MISQKKFRQLQLSELAPENRTQITVRHEKPLDLHDTSFAGVSASAEIAWHLAAQMPGSTETNWMGGRYGYLEAEGLRFSYGRKTGGTLVAIHAGLGNSTRTLPTAERNVGRTLCRLGFPFGIFTPYEDVLSYLHRSFLDIFLPNQDEICCLVADVFYHFRFCPEVGLFAFTATDVSQMLLNKLPNDTTQSSPTMEDYFAKPMIVALEQFGFQSSQYLPLSLEPDEHQEPVIGGHDWLQMMVQRLHHSMTDIRNVLTAEQRLTA
jgi:hypothetical protein